MSIREWQPFAGGVAVVGRIMRGTLKEGVAGELVGYGGPLPVTVAALSKDRRPTPSAAVGEDVAALLTGVEPRALRKGLVLATPGAFRATKTWRAELTLARDDDNPERNTPTYSPTTFTFVGVDATFRLPEAGALIPYAAPVQGTLELAEPLVLFTDITSTVMWGGAIVGDLKVLAPAP